LYRFVSVHGGRGGGGCGGNGRGGGGFGVGGSGGGGSGGGGSGGGSNAFTQGRIHNEEKNRGYIVNFYTCFKNKIPITVTCTFMSIAVSKSLPTEMKE
jgi:hypothetical protein